MTGASSGLGRELVRQLVRDRGMTVLATARRLDRLETLAAELPPGRVVVEAGDLADPELPPTGSGNAPRPCPGGSTCWSTTPGSATTPRSPTRTPRSIRRIIEVNLIALIDLTQRAVRHMTARGSGQILQISSVLGFIGLPYSAVYVASKHAVNGLVKSLRYELRGTGVRVWAACPGRTESEFWNVAIGEAGRTDAIPRGEPAAKVVRAIVRGLDGRRAFLLTGARWPVRRWRWRVGSPGRSSGRCSAGRRAISAARSSAAHRGTEEESSSSGA